MYRYFLFCPQRKLEKRYAAPCCWVPGGLFIPTAWWGTISDIHQRAGPGAFIISRWRGNAHDTGTQGRVGCVPWRAGLGTYLIAVYVAVGLSRRRGALRCMTEGLARLARGAPIFWRFHDSDSSTDGARWRENHPATHFAMCRIVNRLSPLAARAGTRCLPTVTQRYRRHPAGAELFPLRRAAGRTRKIGLSPHAGAGELDPPY